jgi:hypothetical protein
VRQSVRLSLPFVDAAGNRASVIDGSGTCSHTGNNLNQYAAAEKTRVAATPFTLWVMAESLGGPGPRLH